jgi:hypothetical protein
MNLSVEQYNNLNKTKTIALSTLKFWQYTVLKKSDKIL